MILQAVDIGSLATGGGLAAIGAGLTALARALRGPAVALVEWVGAQKELQREMRELLGKIETRMESIERVLASDHTLPTHRQKVSAPPSPAPAGS